MPVRRRGRRQPSSCTAATVLRGLALTRQLRDAQCHPDLEGTEQVCQLDVLRHPATPPTKARALARADRAELASAGPEYVADAVDGEHRSS